MKKFIFITIMIVLSLSLCGCTNKYDTIEIYNKSGTVFDNILIEVKEGYFYDRHEKFTVDENTIGVTVFFSSVEDDE